MTDLISRALHDAATWFALHHPDLPVRYLLEEAERALPAAPGDPWYELSPAPESAEVTALRARVKELEAALAQIKAISLPIFGDHVLDAKTIQRVSAAASAALTPKGGSGGKMCDCGWKAVALANQVTAQSHQKRWASAEALLMMALPCVVAEEDHSLADMIRQHLSRMETQANG